MKRIINMNYFISFYFYIFFIIYKPTILETEFETLKRLKLLYIIYFQLVHSYVYCILFQLMLNI